MEGTNRLNRRLRSETDFDRNASLRKSDGLAKPL